MIPTAELPHRVTITPRTGTSGTGAPAYGPAFTIPARVEGKRRSVRTREGVDVVASATATIRPGRTIPVGSRLALHDLRYEVLDVGDEMELRRPEATVLLLDGPRP